MQDDQKFTYHHFQDTKVTELSLQYTGDIRRTIIVKLGEQETFLNAHEALKLSHLLSSLQETLSELSRKLDHEALEADAVDHERIKREWKNYRDK